MKLEPARHFAELIRGILAPFCERIEIAGSIRRQRPNVNDIDFVLLPKHGLLAALKARCQQRCRVVRDGEQNYIVAMPVSAGQREQLGHSGWEVQVDIFIAHPGKSDLLQTIPSNYGSLLICRTGSKEHNIFLVEHAKRLGLVWSPYKGVEDGDGYVIAGASEGEIFEALGLEFVAPERRER
jgi:DNA polymerase/3'-5' exonuclease PolX